MPVRRRPSHRSFIPTAETMTDLMLDPHRIIADETGLPQTAFAWEGGTSQGIDCALVTAAAPLPAWATVDSIRPGSATGDPLVTLLPSNYLGGN